MQTAIERGRWQPGTCRYYKLYVECRDTGATMQSRRVRRGFLQPRPTFCRRAWEVEARGWQDDEPTFAASFFSPIDAKNAVRQHCS